MKYTRTFNGRSFYVERNYDWKTHKSVYRIWKYDPSAVQSCRAMTWPFADCPQFDSFVHAVKYLKENIEELV